MISNIIPYRFGIQFFKLSKFTLKPNFLVQSSFSRYYTISFPNKSEKWKTAYLTCKKKWHPIQNYLHSDNLKYKTNMLLSTTILYGSLMYWVEYNKQHNIKILGKECQLDRFLKETYISRPEIEKIFHPNNDHSYYHVIYGEIGTGKTMLVRKVAEEVG
jgi:hypothetical protein